MRRRSFLTGAASLAATASAQTPMNKPRAIIELCRFQLRNTMDNMVKRTTDYLKDAHLPALQRAGATTVGVFNRSSDLQDSTEQETD